MTNQVVLMANCREPLYPGPYGNVHPIQVAVVELRRVKGSRVSGSKRVSSLSPTLLNKEGRSFRPYLFLGIVILDEVLGVKGDPELRSLGDHDGFFVKIHVSVFIPFHDIVEGWVALRRFIPGPDYNLLLGRFPQLPVWEHWPT